MNYYEHHIGDYAAATSHLSLLEDAIYSRLLRRYYLQESPLPADDAASARLAGARTAEEVAAAVVVLNEFFPVGDDGLRHNKRADEEIERFRVKVEAARENGKRGGRPPKAPIKTQQKAKETQPFHSGSENKTQLKALQTPVTSNTEPNGSDAAASPEPAADPVWGTGLAFLIRKGVPEKQARSLLGKVKQACGDIEAGALLAQAEAEDITDPAPWLMASASMRRSRAGPQAIAPPSKTLSAIQKLQAMKHGNLDSQRDHGRPEPPALLEPGAHSRR